MHAGSQVGFDDDLSRRLALQTVYRTAWMLVKTQSNPGICAGALHHPGARQKLRCVSWRYRVFGMWWLPTFASSSTENAGDAPPEG